MAQSLLFEEGKYCVAGVHEVLDDGFPVFEVVVCQQAVAVSVDCKHILNFEGRRTDIVCLVLWAHKREMHVIGLSVHYLTTFHNYAAFGPTINSIELQIVQQVFPEGIVMPVTSALSQETDNHIEEEK